jgi:predicted secreted protein
MAKKLGNDYRLWIESSTPGTYNQILGQQSLSYSRSSNQIDVSDKNNSPYALTAAGLFDVSISLEGLADLPDATGYTLLETKFLAQTAWKFQIRKAGTSGVDADKVFAATLNILELSTEFPQNGAVKYSAKFGLSIAPTTDALA